MLALTTFLIVPVSSYQVVGDTISIAHHKNESSLKSTSGATGTATFYIFTNVYHDADCGSSPKPPCVNNNEMQIRIKTWDQNVLYDDKLIPGSPDRIVLTMKTHPTETTNYSVDYAGPFVIKKGIIWGFNGGDIHCEGKLLSGGAPGCIIGVHYADHGIAG
jgi:hypothetical protein